MTEPAQARVYGGVSATERVAQRRRAFVDAALEILSSSGWRHITVDRLAAEAKLGKRYFYELFSDLDAVAGAVVQDTVEGLNEAVTSRMGHAELPVPELAHEVIGAMVRYLTDDPRRARLLFGELGGTPGDHAHQAAALEAVAAMVGARARAVHGAPVNDDPIVPLTACFLVHGTGQVILHWLDGRIATTRDQLIADLADLWVITGDGAADIARHRA